MLESKKKALAMSVLCAVASVGFVVSASAAETDDKPTHELKGIIVEGQADVLPGGFVKSKADIGLLGDSDIMTTPFTVVNISNKSIESFQSPDKGIVDSLTLNPSVRLSSSGTYQDFTIRGFNMTGHHIYVNGIPGLLCQENIPTAWIDSATIIGGPNLGVNGSTLSEAVGGVVNLKSKAAVEDSTKLKLGYRGGSSFEEAIDAQGRFGENDEWGIRVNANNIHGETSVENVNLKQENIFINIDRENEKSKTNFLVGYNHTNHEGGSNGFSFSKDVTQLPDAPDASKNYKPEWFYNEYDNWIVGINHEQKINENLAAFINAGYHREDWYGYLDGGITITNNKGDYTVTGSVYPLALTKEYVGIGLKGDFKLGDVKNDYVIGIDKNWQNYDIGMNPDFNGSGGWSGSGNIYGNNHWNNPGDSRFNPPHSQDIRLTGWHIVDTMKMLDDKLQVTLGLHGHKADLTPAGKDNQESDAICPTYAVSYKITPDVVVYADHTESFGIGKMVSTSNGYENAGEILDPAKTKQNELGIKFKTGSTFHNLSMFEIEQANTVDSFENGNKYLRVDGRQKNKGVEWSFNGEIGNKLDVIGGVMYLDSKDNKGNRVNGASEWSGTLGAIYNPDDNVSIIGRANYLGTTSINNGKLDVPSHLTFDLGMRYKTAVNNTPVTINAMCYNVAGKDYWNAKSGSNSLGLGAPRTFVLSAEFDI